MSIRDGEPESLRQALALYRDLVAGEGDPDLMYWSPDSATWIAEEAEKELAQWDKQAQSLREGEGCAICAMFEMNHEEHRPYAAAYTDSWEDSSGTWERCTDCGGEFLFPHLCREHLLCGNCHPDVRN